MKQWTNILEIILHILFWLLCWWLLHLTLSIESVEILKESSGVERRIYTRAPAMAPFFFANLLVKMVIFYACAFYLLPRFIGKKSWIGLAWRLLLLLLVCFGAELGINRYFNQTGASPFSYFEGTIGINLLMYVFFTLSSFAYRFSKAWYKNERLKKLLVQEKLSTELNFLKSQINPHFLFNTLNNLFAIAERDKNKEVAQGIAELSTLMRYMLYDCQAERVPLEKEVAYLKSIIEIHQLRIAEEDEVLIAFNINGDYIGKKIAPLILVPFVENAFKHGINYKESSFIRIDFEVMAERLLFRVKNSNFEIQWQDHQEHSGIGLENVKRRLQLLYPGHHALDIREAEDIYEIRLEIDLI